MVVVEREGCLAAVIEAAQRLLTTGAAPGRRNTDSALRQSISISGRCGSGPGRGYRCGSLRRSMASASQRAQSASMAAVRNPNSSAARAKKAVSESPHSTESRMCS